MPGYSIRKCNESLWSDLNRFDEYCNMKMKVFRLPGTCLNEHAINNSATDSNVEQAVS